MNQLHQTTPHRSVSILCSLFGKSRQSYYQQINRIYITAVSDDIILEKVLEYRSIMGRIGCRKLHALLKRDLPTKFHIGRDALFDLLDNYGLKVHRKIRRVRTTYSDHWMRKYPNLIRGLIPIKPNQIWVSDITYIETQEGFVYLHLITDAYSRKIVGWIVSPTLEARYTVVALRMAIDGVSGSLNELIHHSDRGVQYCCEKYVKILQDNKIKISMTENGDPLENAIAERVNGIIKMEWLQYETLSNLDHAMSRIGEIVNIYNSQRPHLSIDYLTPDQAHIKSGVIKKHWKNYYKSNNMNNQKINTTFEIANN